MTNIDSDRSDFMEDVNRIHSMFCTCVRFAKTLFFVQPWHQLVHTSIEKYNGVYRGHAVRPLVAALKLRGYQPSHFFRF